MKASRKIVLSISTIYLLLGCLLGFALYSQAIEDVETEIDAANQLAIALVEQGVSFQQIGAALQHSRHITAVITDTPELRSQLPYPLIDQFTSSDNDGRQLLIFANPAAERAEVLTTVYQVFGILTLSLVVSLSFLHLAVQSRMKPLRKLSNALREVGQGNYRVDVAPSDIEEIDSVIVHSRDMASALEQREAKVHQLRARLASLQENERQILARELHDNLGQLVTGLRVQSFMLKQQSNSPKFIERTATLLEQQCDDMQSGIRQLVQQLYPVTLSRMGLVSALQEMLERWAEMNTIAITYSLPDTSVSVSSDSDMHIYRIVQEALSNIIKHAHATRANVTLEVESDTQENAAGENVKLTISDNGIGMAPNTLAENEGLGLESMRERARLIAGTLNITALAGTTITLKAPMQPALQPLREKQKNAHTTC
ncbi:sensor histidine kinase [Alteromonas confluentis]|uniref:histidine kinase n=1 Tax=Alteromonas confluentis TaxID=1656094 RepID=A0A1E7ZBQ4_9ALTE|nr:HAMP domain-containing sensor histidine kinase [Alteromonas confluentis]OFC70955.1 hypothetical protein BFC18_10990 [Alteromonas confluentis]